MVTAPAPVTFTVDPWDPGYGLAFTEDLDGGALGEASAERNLDLERPAAGWHPIDPDPVPRLPGTVLFLDGVRRIDARIWVHGSNPQPGPGIAASFAAGLVSCDGAAHIANVTVERVCSPPPPKQPTSPPATPGIRPGSPAAENPISSPSP
jgi:hypothetical protein